MGALEDRVAVLERDKTEIAQNLAVHLTECAGNYKAIETKMDGIEEKLDTQIKEFRQYREDNTKLLYTLVKTLATGLVLLAVIEVVGPQNALELVRAFLR